MEFVFRNQQSCQLVLRSGIGPLRYFKKQLMPQQLQRGTFCAFCAALCQVEILRCFGERMVFAVRKAKAVLNVNIFPIWQSIHGLMKFSRCLLFNTNLLRQFSAGRINQGFNGIVLCIV